MEIKKNILKDFALRCYRKIPYRIRLFRVTSFNAVKGGMFKIIIYLNKITFNIPIYYSQQYEDIIIYHNYYKKNINPKGVFVEIGGYDGITYSNTKFFEDTLKWKGILIEPVPRNYKKMIKNRPSCINYNVAVGNQKKFTFVGQGGSAGALDFMAESFLKKWHSSINLDTDTFEVEGKTMSEIFTLSKIDKVDLFSLDVEGGELEVLKTINWNDVKIDLFLIELNGHDPSKDEACRNILLENNYKFEMYIGNNEIWKNKIFD